jgi:hypothetical protein
MRWVAQLRIRFAMLFHRGRAAERLDDELSFHLERQIAENIAAGMRPAAARDAALRSFGNPALSGVGRNRRTGAESVILARLFCAQRLHGIDA